MDVGVSRVCVCRAARVCRGERDRPQAGAQKTAAHEREGKRNPSVGCNQKYAAFFCLYL